MYTTASSYFKPSSKQIILSLYEKFLGGLKSAIKHYKKERARGGDKGDASRRGLKVFAAKKKC